MRNQQSIWKLTINSLEQQIPVTLLYVLESIGSSPGRQGFFMAVRADGTMEGSIGGGIMEHRFVEIAKKRLAQTQKPKVRKQIHAKTSGEHSSGMICSGEQTILLYSVKQEDSVVIQKIVSALEKNHQGSLIFSPAGIQFDAALPLQNYQFAMNSEDDWIYKEKIGYKNLLTIIGGGHCSLAFSKLMRQMDFYIKVYDDRKELKTMLENHAAHEKQVISDYAELKNLIASGQNHYVVIMTFGYRSDDIALRVLLDKKFRYLGLLGSKEKINKMFVDYRKEKIDEQLLQRVFTPIGLSIGSQTPDEIAISIAAEIIREKNLLSF